MDCQRRLPATSLSVAANRWTLSEPSPCESTRRLAGLDGLSGLDPTAQPGIRLGQQVALQTERIAQCGSGEPTVRDQDFTQDLAGFPLRLKCPRELSL